jgi:hypothetical protein
VIVRDLQAKREADIARLSVTIENCELTIVAKTARIAQLDEEAAVEAAIEAAEGGIAGAESAGSESAPGGDGDGDGDDTSVAARADEDTGTGEGTGTGKTQEKLTGRPADAVAIAPRASSRIASASSAVGKVDARDLSADELAKLEEKRQNRIERRERYRESAVEAIAAANERIDEIRPELDALRREHAFFQRQIESMAVARRDRGRADDGVGGGGGGDGGGDSDSDGDDDETECMICYERPRDTILPCAHVFCSSCIKHAAPVVNGVQTRGQCPMCRQSFVIGDARRVVPTLPPAGGDDDDDDDDGDDGYGDGDDPVVDENDPRAKKRRRRRWVKTFGSKFARIVTLVKRNVERGERTLLFAQWRSLSRTLTRMLRDCGVRVKDVTPHNAATRNAILTDFRSENPANDALLLSIEGSSAGMNLVRANHVVFMHALVPRAGIDAGEVERLRHQAVARVWRMGQERACHVHHFLARGTVEEDLLPRTLAYIRDATEEPDTLLEG